MKRVTTLFVMVALGTAAPTLRASVASELSAAATLRQALTQYESAVASKTSNPEESQQLFERAALGFRDLLDGGHKSAGLYYNLANSLVRLGRIGPAIVNYRRALRLEPGNERIQRNLEFARSRVETPIPSAPLSQFTQTVFSWHHNTAFSSRLVLAVCGYVMFWLLLMVARQFSLRATWLTWMKWTIAAFTIAVWTSVAVERFHRMHITEGVLTTNNVVLRKGYGENYDPQLDRPLSEGVEVLIRETREDVEGKEWFYVELSDGKGGWLRADQCSII